MSGVTSENCYLQLSLIFHIFRVSVTILFCKRGIMWAEFSVIFGGGKFTIYGIKRNFYFEHTGDILFR